MKDCGISGFMPSPPDPLNLFMNIPVTMREYEQGLNSAGGALSFDEPVSKKGDFVILRALQDSCIVVMSACPQDILKINGQNPTDAHFVVLDA